MIHTRMKKFVLTVSIVVLAFGFSYAQKNRKLSKEEQANLTPEQRIARDNDRVHSKKKGKKDDNVAKKVKRPRNRIRQTGE